MKLSRSVYRAPADAPLWATESPDKIPAPTRKGRAGRARPALSLSRPAPADNEDIPQRGAEFRAGGARPSWNSEGHKSNPRFALVELFEENAKRADLRASRSDSGSPQPRSTRGWCDGRLRNSPVSDGAASEDAEQLGAAWQRKELLPLSCPNSPLRGDWSAEERPDPGAEPREGDSGFQLVQRARRAGAEQARQAERAKEVAEQVRTPSLPPREERLPLEVEVLTLSERMQQLSTPTHRRAWRDEGGREFVARPYKNFANLSKRQMELFERARVF